MKRCIALVITLLASSVFGQMTFQRNYKSQPYVIINNNIDAVQATVATADSGCIKFYKTGAQGQWEIAMYDSNGTEVLYVDSTGSIVSTGNIEAATYGSDASITDAEFLYINTLS